MHISQVCCFKHATPKFFLYVLQIVLILYLYISMGTVSITSTAYANISLQWRRARIHILKIEKYFKLCYCASHPISYLMSQGMEETGTVRTWRWRGHEVFPHQSVTLALKSHWFCRVKITRLRDVSVIYTYISYLHTLSTGGLRASLRGPAAQSAHLCWDLNSRASSPTQLQVQLYTHFTLTLHSELRRSRTANTSQSHRQSYVTQSFSVKPDLYRIAITLCLTLVGKMISSVHPSVYTHTVCSHTHGEV